MQDFWDFFWNFGDLGNLRNERMPHQRQLNVNWPFILNLTNKSNGKD